MCTRPSFLAPKSTKAPYVVTEVTLPLISCPSSRLSSWMRGFLFLFRALLFVFRKVFRNASRTMAFSPFPFFFLLNATLCYAIHSKLVGHSFVLRCVCESISTSLSLSLSCFSPNLPSPWRFWLFCCCCCCCCCWLWCLTRRRCFLLLLLSARCTGLLGLCCEIVCAQHKEVLGAPPSPAACCLLLYSSASPCPRCHQLPLAEGRGCWSDTSRLTSLHSAIYHALFFYIHNKREPLRPGP